MSHYENKSSALSSSPRHEALDLPKAENKPAEKTIEAHVEAPVADEKIHLLMVDPHNPAGAKLY